MTKRAEKKIKKYLDKAMSLARKEGVTYFTSYMFNNEEHKVFNVKALENETSCLDYWKHFE